MILISLPSSAGVIVESDFKPHPFLKGPHAQTIWPRLLHKEGSQIFERQRLSLPDNDFVDLDWFPGNEKSDQLALLIHGLGGSSSSHYIKRIGKGLVSAGFRVVVFNLRGATDPNLSVRSYHSGETLDLNFVLETLSKLPQYRHRVVAGFSLGGNMLLKWLGENPNQVLVSQAVSVSPPFELAIVSRSLDKGFSKGYRNSILKGLKNYVRRKSNLLENEIDLQAAYQSKTFFQYDEAVTAPIHGFKSAEDYYTKNSSRQFLKYIETPTLIIHSWDDPFATPEIIPTQMELGDGVVLELSERGGHLGFVSRGNGLKSRFWLPERIVRYFSGLA